MRPFVLVAASLVIAACSKKEPPKTDRTETTSGPIASPLVEKGDAKDGGAPQGVTVDPRALPARPSPGPTAVEPPAPVDLRGPLPNGMRGAQPGDVPAPAAAGDRASPPALGGKPEPGANGPGANGSGANGPGSSGAGGGGP